jgi:hypothetical protein
MSKKSLLLLAPAIIFLISAFAQAVPLGHRGEELLALQAALRKEPASVRQNLVTGMSPDGFSNETLIPTVTILLPNDAQGYDSATVEEQTKLFNAVKTIAKELGEKPGCLTMSFQVQAVLSTGQKVSFCMWGKTPDGRWDMACRAASVVMEY